MNESNIFEVYKTNSKGIKRVEINSEKLKIFWSINQIEVFYLKDLKKVALITTDEGPFEPDMFWLLMFDFPIMIPSDELIPGSLTIVDFLLKLPNFNYKKFIEAMSCMDNKPFELWEKKIPN